MLLSAIRTLIILILGGLVFMVAVPSSRASEEKVQLAQLEHTTWRLQDGVFTGAPRGIAQTKDGYLWIGTMRGLVRFDGVRFVPWKPPEKQRLGSLVIRSLLADRDGSLWIGTTTGLAHWTNGQLISYAGPVAYIESIFEGRDGTIWITRSRIRDWSGPICRVEGPKLHCYGKSDGIEAISASSVVEDTKANLWFGGSGALIERKADRFQSITLPGIPLGHSIYAINGLAKGPNDSVWVGLGNLGPHLGLENFVDGRWSTFSGSSFDGSTHQITALFRDKDGCLWVGTEHSGIYRIDGDQVDTFDRADGLSSNNITGFQQDSEGDVWVTTEGGLDVFRRRAVVTYSSRESLSADGVHAVIKRKDGSLWMSNSAAIDIFLNRKVRSIDKRNGLPGRAPTSLLEDREGRLWLGVDLGLLVYTDGRFRTIIPPATHNNVIGLTQDLHDDIWAVFAGPSPKLIRIRDFKVQEEFDPPTMPAAFSAVSDQRGGIWINLLQGGLIHLNNGTKDELNLSQFNVGWPSPLSIFNLYVEADGTVWGASNRGLIGYRKGRQQALTEQNGLPCSSVYSVIEDAHSAIWLYSQCGLMRIDREELERWWANPGFKISMKLFDETEGVQPGIPLYRPAATRSDDGRLWFANGRGVQVVDPDHLESNPIAPPVSIEQLSADDHVFPISGERKLPALTRQIQIEYTALSFLLPSRVRFRYRLEGYEVNWEDPGTRRAAFYNNLNPGHYRFHVIACNNDGIWNNNGATLDFSIAPAFYQTYWFRTISLIVAVLILWRIYLWRLQYVTEQLQIQSDARTAERERIARDLHDTLLQGFHGVMLRLQAVLKDLPPNGNARTNMENALDRADEVILEGRERVSVLRSRAQLKGDLPEAVRTVCHQLLDGSRITLNFSVLGRPAQLSQAAFEEIYQIAREALSNACRHSGASEIKVEFNYASHNLNMKIADNGVGMEDVVRTSGKEGHWGLLGMRERAERIKATLSITSQPGLGTIIDVRIRSRFAYAGNRRRFLSRFVGKDGVSLG